MCVDDQSKADMNWNIPFYPLIALFSVIARRLVSVDRLVYVVSMVGDCWPGGWRDELKSWLCLPVCVQARDILRQPSGLPIDLEWLLAVKRKITAGIAIIALTVTSCSGYRSNLEYSSGERADEVIHADRLAGDPRFVLPEGVVIDETTDLTLPYPETSERIVRGEPKVDPATGWVHFIFDVDKTGAISNIRLHRSTNPELEEAARKLLESWKFKPATIERSPVAFTDMEIVVTFAPMTQRGAKVAGWTLLAIVLLPVALVLLATALPGSIMRGAFNRQDD
jgi:TonB family protein